MIEYAKLPSGWTKCQLGDLLQPTLAADPKLSGRITFQYVDIDAVDNRVQRIANPKKLAVDQAPSRARRLLKHNDVIISLVRPYLKNIAIVPKELDDQWASSAFTVCRTRKGVLPTFLFNLFSRDEFIREIPTYGDSPPSGHPEDLMAMEVLLPSTKEQAQIVDRIDELFTDLDSGVAALQRVQKKLIRYRAALLHAAITGRLTADWRAKHAAGSESGKALLENILQARRKEWERCTLQGYTFDDRELPEGWQKRYQEPTKPKLDQLPSLPNTWIWATQDQIGDVQLGRQRSPRHHSGPHMRQYLRVANVYEDRIVTEDVLQMNFTPKEFLTYQLRHGDLLFNEGQSMELVGRPAMFRDELPNCCFQNTLVRQRVFSGVHPRYALIVALAQFRSGRYRKIAKITTSIAHLGAERFKGVEFPLPPMDEQAHIVDLVEQRLSQIEAMKLEVTRSLRRGSRLRQSILKSAFEGRLLPQDPNDEPASELLAKILADANSAVAAVARPKRTARKSSSASDTPLLDAMEAAPKKLRKNSQKNASKESS